MTRRLALLAALPLLAACGTDTAGPQGNPAPGPTDGPVGDYASDDLPAPFAEGDTLRVTFRDDEISFRATCNTMSGRVEWADGELRISNLGGTEMGCPGAGFEQDEWLVDVFSSSPDLTVDGTDVRLTADDGEIWLVPADEVAPDPGPDTALEGTDWRLTGIEEADGDSVGIMGVPRRWGARFEVDGNQIVFETGCNAGEGAVTVQQGQLRLRRVAIELTGCPGIRQTIESPQVPVVMSKQVAWSIDGRELRLTRGDTTLIYRAG